MIHLFSQKKKFWKINSMIIFLWKLLDITSLLKKKNKHRKKTKKENISYSKFPFDWKSNKTEVYSNSKPIAVDQNQSKLCKRTAYIEIDMSLFKTIHSLNSVNRICQPWRVTGGASAHEDLGGGYSWDSEALAGWMLLTEGRTYVKRLETRKISLTLSLRRLLYTPGARRLEEKLRCL